jgi:hypothetical protein
MEYYAILPGMTRSRIERISITLPAELVRWADREAKRLGRPRSWVIAEALRGAAVSETPGPGLVREAVQAPYGTTPGLGEYRASQVSRDLTLSPEERVRAAEESVRLGEKLYRRIRRHELILFDRFEDYLAWKSKGRIES